MAVKSGSQNALILVALSDHRWHTTAAIHRMAGTSRLNSRISELKRRHGYDITCEYVSGKKGANAYRYRLSTETPVPPHLLIGHVAARQEAEERREAVPRDPNNRYRLYRLIRDRLEIVDSAADESELGRATLFHARLSMWAGATLGLLDTFGREEGGRWIINPWDTTN